MPLYDYACRACGHAFEIRQSFSDASLTECPQCGGEIRRVIAPVGIVFKGGGYYVTDSRKPGKGGGTGEAKGSTAAAGESGTAASVDAGTDTPAGDAGRAGATAGAAEPAPTKEAAKTPDPGAGSASGAGAAPSAKPEA